MVQTVALTNVLFMLLKCQIFLSIPIVIPYLDAPVMCCFRSKLTNENDHPLFFSFFFFFEIQKQKQKTKHLESPNQDLKVG